MQKKVLLASAILGSALLIYRIQKIENEKALPLMETSSFPKTPSSSQLTPRDAAARPLEASPLTLRVIASKVPETVEPISVHGEFPELYGDNEAYCRVKAANLGIPLEGDVRIISSVRSIVNGKGGGREVMVSGDGCAEGTYSIVKFNLDHEVEDILDCREPTRQALIMRRGGPAYGGDNPVPSPAGKLYVNSRNGLFVSSCGSQVRYFLNGDFQIKDEVLLDADGCEVMDRAGQKIKIKHGEKPDIRGCFQSSQCIATVNLNEHSFEVLDEYTFNATGNPLDILVPTKEVHIAEGEVRFRNEITVLEDANILKVPVLSKRQCPVTF